MRDLLWRCDEHRGPDADFPALRAKAQPPGPLVGTVMQSVALVANLGSATTAARALGLPKIAQSRGQR